MDNDFYDNLKRNDESIADCRFQMQQELIHYFCWLIGPLGKQNSSRSDIETTEITNLSIHHELAVIGSKPSKV